MLKCSFSAFSRRRIIAFISSMRSRTWIACSNSSRPASVRTRGRTLRSNSATLPAVRTAAVQDVINDNPVSRFQYLVIALCCLVVAIDGFDTAAVGFIAPALRAR